jgi:two-component system nitrate/nitrite response regulator NarL
MRVLLVGDMGLLWEGIAQALAAQGVSRSVVRLSTITEAVNQVRRSRSDVALVQSRLPDGKACEAVRLLRNVDDGIRVIVLGISDRNEETFLAALGEGASGFIDSTASFGDLLACVRRVVAGDTFIPHNLAIRLASEYKKRGVRPPEGPYLTGREMEVLWLLAQGYSNKAMARRLVVSEHTVRAHLRNIMHKLNAENRVQAVARATRDGLLAEDGLSLPEEHHRALIA